MTLPSAEKVYGVIDATWPAAQKVMNGPFSLRRGAGGGSRVSAATANGPVEGVDIECASAKMIAWEQDPLFMIRENDRSLDAQLTALGYVIKDPVHLYAAPIDAMTQERLPPLTSFAVWPPLCCQQEIWDEGGVSANRIAVMERADVPKTTLLGRSGDAPASTVYLGIKDKCAMIHALEVHQDHRNMGMGKSLTIAAAFWAKKQGAAFLTLVTTRENKGANRLYSSLGMSIVGGYHYRVKPMGDQT